MEITVVEAEQWWIGAILSFGELVEILEPKHIRIRVIEIAKQILSVYS